MARLGADVAIMEASVFPSIVTALAALGGVALTAYVQSRAQAKAQTFQAVSEVERHHREQWACDRAETLNRLVAMHKLVSKVQREFSITTLDILWRAKTAGDEYDFRYLAICEEADELRALAQLHEPAVCDAVEQMHGQMNIFWGAFKNLLHQCAKGERVDHLNASLADAHAASKEVEALGHKVKFRLAERMREMHAAIFPSQSSD